MVLSPCDVCGLEAEVFSRYCEEHDDQSRYREDGDTFRRPARLLTAVGVMAGAFAVVCLLIAARVLITGAASK